MSLPPPVDPSRPPPLSSPHQNDSQPPAPATPSANTNTPSPNSPNSTSTTTPAPRPGSQPQPEAEPDALFLDATSPQGGRGGMSSFIFMSIMLYMLSSGGGEDFALRQQYRDSLHTLRMQQANFSAWLWEGVAGNGTGGIGGGNESVGLGNKSESETEGVVMNFTLPETDLSSITLAHAVMTFGVPLNPTFASYYTNVSGFVHGPVKMYNLTSLTSFFSNSSLPEAPPAPPALTAPGSEIPLPLHVLSSDSSVSALPPIWAGYAPTFLTPSFNTSSALERIGSWNWSAPLELAFRMLEKQPIVSPGPGKRMNASTWKDVSLMHGRLELKDKDTGEEISFDMEAVHFLENGTVYGFAEPAGRHVDVRHLPSLVPKQYLNATAQAVNAELIARIKRLQDVVDSGSLEIDAQSSDDAPKTTCPFTIFGQLVPTPVPFDLMKELEDELQNPTGITTVSRPELRMNAVLMSKECGILLEMHEAVGLIAQRFWRKVTTYSFIAALVYVMLLVLYIRQNAVSETPTGISRLSRWTFLTQAAADSIAFVGHTTFGVVADGRPSLALIVPAFFAAILVAFESQFAILIQQIQGPEEVQPTPAPRAQVQASATAPSTAATPAENTANPVSIPGTTQPSQDREVQQPLLPTTAQVPSPTPTRTPPLTPPARLLLFWRNVRENPTLRFWITVFLSLIILARVLVSPSLALAVIGMIYSNFWVPQIVRSARRGTASGLRAEYLVGTTACRAFFALYLFACPKNVLDIDTSPLIYVLVGFVCLQVVVVLLQDYLGSSFFLPRSYTPIHKYDYHPYIPPPDDEAPEPSLGDCAICMDAILIQPDLDISSATLTSSHQRSKSSGSIHEKKSRSSFAMTSLNDREREKRQETAGRGGYVRVRVFPGRWWVYGWSRARWVLERVGVVRRRRRDEGDDDGEGEGVGGNGVWGRESGRGRSTGVGLSITASGARRSYALAPCHHLFHTACLERWLAIKNICPQCRRPLPPL